MSIRVLRGRNEYVVLDLDDGAAIVLISVLHFPEWYVDCLPLLARRLRARQRYGDGRIWSDQVPRCDQVPLLGETPGAT